MNKFVKAPQLSCVAPGFVPQSVWPSELHLLTLLSSALCQGDLGSSAGEVIWIVIEMLRGYSVEDSVEGEIQRVK